MRAAAPIALLLLAACSREPDFDERYNDQANQMNATAARIQAELDGQLNAAQAAETNPAQANGAAAR